MVEATNVGCQSEARVFESLLDAVVKDCFAVIDRDTIVIRVEGFDEIIVKFLVEEFGIWAVYWESNMASNYVFTMVLVDETGGRELCLVESVEGLLETTLMVIVSRI